MTYLKVGDGVYVNGEINPYNLGGWCKPQVSPDGDYGRTNRVEVETRDEIGIVSDRIHLATGVSHADVTIHPAAYQRKDEQGFNRINGLLRELHDASPSCASRGVDWKEAIAQRERDRKFLTGFIDEAHNVLWNEFLKQPETIAFVKTQNESATDLVNRVAAEQREGKA